MPKTDAENDQVVIRKDTESENENDASNEPPAKKVKSTSAPSTSMPSRRETSKERETNKITGGSEHHDSLVALDRLLISENLLKRRISRFDLKGSMDVNREIDHINHRADLFSSDTTEAELKELRSVMKRFEATQPLTYGKEIADIHCCRSFRITKVEKFENLSLEW